MQKNSTARLFPIFITFIVIVIVIVAIISIGRAMFAGTSEDASVDEIDSGRTALLDSNPNHSVSLTVRGPIVAEEQFKSYRVAVSPTARSLVVYKGYLETAEKDKTLDNNKTAYEQFIFALDKANMMKGRAPADDTSDDLRGICASGFIYEYSVLVDGKSTKRLWTSTCGGSKGTLEASTTQLNNLFMAQIPDGEKLLPFNQSSLQLKF